MAAFRLLLVLLALLGFFLIGAPLQWLVARHAPRAAHRIPLVFCRSLLALLRVRVDVHGERVVGRPVIIAPNHVSWIDILAFGGIMPFCFLAKSDVSRWPIVSAFAGVQGTVFVDRTRRRSIPQANRQMAARMLEGRSVLLFAEATTVAPPLPARFHSSHFAAARDLLRQAEGQSEVLVQPVAIRYSSDAAAWVGDDDLLSHLWRTLSESPLRCAITFGAPLAYRPTSDRKTIARQARESVVAMLGRATIVENHADAGVDLGRPAETRI